MTVKKEGVDDNGCCICKEKFTEENPATAPAGIPNGGTGVACKKCADKAIR